MVSWVAHLGLAQWVQINQVGRPGGSWGLFQSGVSSLLSGGTRQAPSSRLRAPSSWGTISASGSGPELGRFVGGAQDCPRRGAGHKLHSARGAGRPAPPPANELMVGLIMSREAAQEASSASVQFRRRKFCRLCGHFVRCSRVGPVCVCVCVAGTQWAADRNWVNQPAGCRVSLAAARGSSAASAQPQSVASNWRQDRPESCQTVSCGGTWFASGASLQFCIQMGPVSVSSFVSVAFWDSFGRILDTFWAHFGYVFVAFWIRFGPNARVWPKVCANLDALLGAR